MLRLAVLGKYPKIQSAVSVLKAAWQGDAISLRNLLVTTSGESCSFAKLLSHVILLLRKVIITSYIAGHKIINSQSEEGLTPLLVVTRDVNIFLRRE